MNKVPAHYVRSNCCKAYQDSANETCVRCGVPFVPEEAAKQNAHLMEIPLVEIEALCAYVEINLEMDIEMNTQDWRQSTQKVRAWLDAAEQLRAPDVAERSATLSGLYNCQVCGEEKCRQPGICAECLTPPTIEQEVEWCENNKGGSGKGEAFEDGFIAGLKQAKFLYVACNCGDESRDV